MTQNKFGIESIKQAYKKLKRDIYFDQINLFLRKRIADFECQKNFENKLSKLAEMLRRKSSSEEYKNYFNKLYEEIDYKLLAKSLKTGDKDKGFITNYVSEENYQVEKVNYFIDMPIELHLVDVLWSSRCGAKLDKKLLDGCLGNRVSHKKNSDTLFMFYQSQYSKWRNAAIQKAQKSLENGVDVLILGLDIKEFFYNIKIDWKAIQGTNEKDRKLTAIIKSIHEKYRAVTKKSIKITHKIDDDIGIPVGLASSRILSNWHLHSFDKNIKHKLRPIY
ncbi:MAG: hypothetical protein KAR45_07810, partial [Desulfobacteraceae bacterium]|nr:hypothetical protein [Desulfobacteraceae bacterium]